MILGTTLFRLDGSTYYSPEFPRGGEAALFSIEITHVGGTPAVTVALEHRNEDETSWTSAGTFSSISATGVYSKDLSGLKEILRFAITITSAPATDAVHFLLPSPAWRPY